MDGKLYTCNKMGLGRTVKGKPVAICVYSGNNPEGRELKFAVDEEKGVIKVNDKGILMETKYSGLLDIHYLSVDSSCITGPESRIVGNLFACGYIDCFYKLIRGKSDILTLPAEDGKIKCESICVGIGPEGKYHAFSEFDGMREDDRVLRVRGESPQDIADELFGMNTGGVISAAVALFDNSLTDKPCHMAVRNRNEAIF